MKSNFFMTFLIILMGVQFMNSIDLNKDKDFFKIIFWDKKIDSDIIDLYKLTFEEIKQQYKPSFILTSKHVIKYYWDEQFLVINLENLEKDGFIPSYTSTFTVVFKNKIIFHGLDRTFISSRKLLYNDSSYPTIQFLPSNNNILCIKPQFLPISKTFKFFTEEEKRRIINKNIYNYFKKIGKIVHGDFD